MINCEDSEPSVAIIGEEPEALLLAILYAEAGVPNYLVGSFRGDDRKYVDRSGIEEALWLLQIHRRSGKIILTSDSDHLPLSRIKTLIIATHPSNPHRANSLEMTIRRLAPRISPDTQLAFAGLCRPHYTASVFKSTVEKHSGLRIGTELGLSYISLHWRGERVQEFKEKPKVIAGYEGKLSYSFQEELLQVFPALSKAPTVELAEAAGLFSVVSHEVINALKLELAGMSERLGLNYDEVLGLCAQTGANLGGHSVLLPGRESIGTGLALFGANRREGSFIVRAAHRVNEDYQSHIMGMISRALNHCGQRLRRSRIAILGVEGLVRDSWTRPESPTIIKTLRKRGARVSLYPGESQGESWAQRVGGDARVENNLLRAVSQATCAVVALSKSAALELDTDRLALEMNRPGAICDLTRVLEASNVERAGLFYTSIGRGTLDA